MNLSGRRTSSNVEDRRGLSGGGKAGMGIGGLIIAGLLTWMMGGNPLDVLQSGLSQNIGYSQADYQPTAKEEARAQLVSQVLAGTEDVWGTIFKNSGQTYPAPKLVLFRDAVQSSCGGATSAVGPFYCSADQTVYIDLAFYDQMENELKAGGDFAYAYVIAHEVGHHVQNVLGTMDQVNAQSARSSRTEANRLSVRLELQADFYAGIWAHYDNKMFGSIEDGDIEDGLNAAQQIGDDMLQKKAQGHVVPDAFTHGTSAQRMRWLKKGLSTGDISQGDTFSVDYNSL